MVVCEICLHPSLNDFIALHSLNRLSIVLHMERVSFQWPVYMYLEKKMHATLNGATINNSMEHKSNVRNHFFYFDESILFSAQPLNIGFPDNI